MAGIPRGKNNSSLSINMLVDDALGECSPRLLLRYVINKLCNAFRRHIVDNDVWFGGEALKELGHAIKLRNLLAVVSPDGGPKKQSEIDIYQDVRVFSFCKLDDQLRRFTDVVYSRVPVRRRW